MIKQTHRDIADDANKLNNHETLAVSNYSSEPPPNSKSYSKEKLKTDDLIVMLSDAYENKRARQVIEWEITRRKSFQKAA